MPSTHLAVPKSAAKRISHKMLPKKTAPRVMKNPLQRPPFDTQFSVNSSLESSIEKKRSLLRENTRYRSREIKKLTSAATTERHNSTQSKPQRVSLGLKKTTHYLGIKNNAMDLNFFRWLEGCRGRRAGRRTRLLANHAAI